MNLRKCKVGKGDRPAYFHGWFQFGCSSDDIAGMAIVEFEDGKTDYFSPGHITFSALPLAEPKCECIANNDNMLKLLRDLRDYIGSGVENRKSDIVFIDRIDTAIDNLTMSIKA